MPEAYTNKRQCLGSKDAMCVKARAHAMTYELLWAGVMKLAMLMPGNSLALPMALMGKAGITINAVLMVLNLLPLLPLDGGRIALSLLPPRLAYSYSRLEPYGMIILVLLLFSGMLNAILWPLISMAMALISSLFGL